MKLDSNKRRRFLTQCLATSGMLAIGPNLWGSVGGSPRPAASGGGYRSLPFTPRNYGPLLPADENGVRLPEGFTSRIVARAFQQVPNSNYAWHQFPDGGATYATGDGGWIYVSNSEIPVLPIGGVGALRFNADGDIIDAYSILGGTRMNCAGGPTPWGTWLSCEEVPDGLVYECDPTGTNLAVQRPAMGTFQHEAAAVDPVHRTVYLTEDVDDGGFYRFTPDTFGDLSSGLLEIAELQWKGEIADVVWHEVPTPNPLLPLQTPTRNQVPESSAFDGGEGAWYSRGFVYFTTKGDNRIWALNTFNQTIEIVYDDDTHPNPILTGVDNVTVGPLGNVMVAEDGGDLQIVALSPAGETFPVMQVVNGPDNHDQSEITGPAFSPDGRRLYFSSQRANGNGITYEITGPFNDTLFQDSFESAPIR